MPSAVLTTQWTSTMARLVEKSEKPAAQKRDGLRGTTRHPAQASKERKDSLGLASKPPGLIMRVQCQTAFYQELFHIPNDTHTAPELSRSRWINVL